MVPSWLDEGTDLTSPQEFDKVDPIPLDPQRFKAPRNSFTKYTKTGGNRGDGGLRHAISSYVRNSTGGSQNATKRLGSARSSTARLFSVVSGFANNGVRTTANNLRLGEIMGKTATDAFLWIAKFVCPDGGTTEDGIARSAYIDALVVMPDWDNKTIESLTLPELLSFTVIYMENVIEKRILNDIGNKLITLPKDIAQIDSLQQQMKGFIMGAVSDALSMLNVDIKNINATQTQRIVDSVYQTAFDIMSDLEV
jgi:hypothetical protein